MLENLYIDSCPRLRKLDGVPQLCDFNCLPNSSLEELTFQISHRPTTICHLGTCNHPEIMCISKLESIGNVEAEIINNLGLSNWRSMGNLTVKLTSWSGMQQRRFPIQVCYDTHIISAYIPGSKAPPCFNFKNLGSTVDFIVPSYLNMRIRGLNVCSVYSHNGYLKREAHTVIRNRTKGLVWSYCPAVFGTAEDGEDTMWLSYWKFGNHFESGDEVNISVYGGKFVQVKEVGVRLLHEEEKEEMSSQSAFETEIPHQLYQFENIVPGNVSALQPCTKLYQLGLHDNDLCYCDHLYPPPWILATLYDDVTVECQASRLWMIRPFYVNVDI